MSPDGKLLFVTDMRNSRMQVVEAMTLKPVGAFGEGQLSNPHDAEFDQNGRLLVADTGNDRVAIYEVRGANAMLAGELTGLSGPEGVAVAPDGRVIVTNTRAGTLSVFRDGRLERTIGRRGAQDGEFSSPHDVEAAADGSVYIVDSGNNRVQVFDATLNYRTQFNPALDLDAPSPDISSEGVGGAVQSRLESGYRDQIQGGSTDARLYRSTRFVWECGSAPDRGWI